MASYSTNEFRSGLKVLLEGDPCTILDNEFVKPGKGAGVQSRQVPQSENRSGLGADVQIG